MAMSLGFYIGLSAAVYTTLGQTAEPGDPSMTQPAHLEAAAPAREAENSFIAPAVNHPVGQYDDHFSSPVVDSHSRGVERHLNLPSWHQEASKVPLNGHFVIEAKDREEVRSMRALGFERIDVRTYVRRVDLMEKYDLAYFDSESLPRLNAIVIVSVFRNSIEEQYLYRTLRSLFTEFPEDAIFNVAVGNSDDNYVSKRALTAAFGRKNADRINVIPCPDEISDFFRKGDFSTSAKANWNFNRILRSYNGGANLMVIEDDVEFAANSVANIAPWLNYMPSYVVSLFNAACVQSPGAWTHPQSVLSIDFNSVRRNTTCMTPQAAVYSHLMTEKAGVYLAYRLDRESHDYLLARFLSGTAVGTSRFYPSPVQHIGYATTGLSSKEYLPISHCYQDVLDVIDEPYSGGM